MGIELYWDNNEQTVLLCEVDGPWTWEELHDTVRKIKKVSAQSDGELAAILDVSRGLFIPGGSVFTPAGFENGMRLMREIQGDGELGDLVVVGMTGMVKTIVDTFNGWDSNKSLSGIKSAKTLEDARQALGVYYPSEVSA